MAINRLLPNDIASVVVFDHTVNVLVPAQQRRRSRPVRRRRQPHRRAVAPPPSTPACCMGAAEVRQEQGPAPPQPRRPALRRRSQCRPVAGPAISPLLGQALLLAGHLGQHHRPRPRLQRGPDAAACPRQRRQPRFRARPDRPHQHLQQGVRRCAGLVRADRLGRHRAQARRARRAGAEPRRRHRGPAGAVHAQPGLCRNRALRAARGRARQGAGRRRRRAGARPRQGRLHRARTAAPSQALDAPIRGRFTDVRARRSRPAPTPRWPRRSSSRSRASAPSAPSRCRTRARSRKRASC